MIYVKSSAVAEMGDCGYNRQTEKRGGCHAPFSGQLGPRLTQCGLGRGLLPYQVTSSSIQPFDHNRHELGTLPFLGAAPTNNVAWAEVYLRTKWHPDPSSSLATIDMGQKLAEGAVPFFCGWGWVPSNTKSPGPRPTSIQSGTLIQHLWTPIQHMIPTAHPTPQPKRHHYRFSRLCTDYRRVTLFLYNGTRILPQKFAPSHGGSGPHLVWFPGPHKSQPKRQLDRCSRFCRAH